MNMVIPPTKTHIKISIQLCIAFLRALLSYRYYAVFEVNVKPCQAVILFFRWISMTATPT